MSQFTARYSQLALSISLLLSGTTALSAPNDKSEDKKTHIGDINVSEKSDADTQGYDNIYDKDISNVYLGKEEIERYKGTSPGDLLKGTVGVFSGETRNGGAIDPNIRGIQGQGRIPVTVDGTEQAITAYRGYYGANNRNYLDPNMIRSVEIEKGPSLSQNLKSSVGGGIAIETINIDDVVKAEDKFGINVLMEMSNNSVKPRLPHLIYGEDYRDLGYKANKRYAFDDPYINVPTKNRNDSFLHGLNDSAYRIGLGFRQKRFDFMLAFSHRKSGNYFSGHRGANNYSKPFTEQDRAIYVGSSRDRKFDQNMADPFLPFAANLYYPGHEVQNTSNMMETLLIKNNWRISDEQVLNLTFRNTQTRFGDILPSRLSMFYPENNLLPQWPEGRVSQKAGSINYKFESDKYSYLNLSSSLWFNHTGSKLNTAGGFPRYPTQLDFYYEDLDAYDPEIDGSLMDSASNHNQNNRWGFDLKNKIKLNRQVNLTLLGNFQYEKLANAHPYESGYETLTFTPPREGRRQEYHLGFNLNWVPIERLTFNAGAQYNSYWSIDDFIGKYNAKKKRKIGKANERSGIIATYLQLLSPDIQAKHKQYITVYREQSRLYGLEDEAKAQLKEIETQQHISKDKHLDSEANRLQREILRLRSEANNLQPEIHKSFKERRDSLNGKRPYEHEFDGYIYAVEKMVTPVNSDGLITKENTATFNGDIDFDEKVLDPVTGLYVNKYIRHSLTSQAITTSHNKRTGEDLYAKNPKRKNSNWAPVLTTTLNMTDDWQAYIRYAEAVRMPSLYEDTSNIAGARFNKAGNQFEPERSRTFEFGTSYDLSTLLNTKNHADIKISYFDTQLENVFDRNNLAQMIQLDKQLISGIELQARYDNGIFFSDIGAYYNLKTKVCDEDSFVSMNIFNRQNIPECIDGGYPNGFLRTAIPPKYSINGNIGVRLIDEKLKLGSRFVYHSKVVNKDELYLQKMLPSLFKGVNVNPVRWNQVFTLDAYVSYKITPDTTVELIGTNMLDEYYLDPLTRSMMPAPGRTFKLMLTSQF